MFTYAFILTGSPEVSLLLLSLGLKDSEPWPASKQPSINSEISLEP